MSSGGANAAVRRGVFGTDFRPEEVLAACILAASMPVWLGIALAISKLDRFGDAPDVDPGMGTPVRVTPVADMDSPLLKKGGKYQLPKEWQAPEPAPTVAPPPGPVVSPQSKDDPDAIPDNDKPVFDGGAPPDPDASTSEDADGGPAAPPDDAGGGGSNGGTGDGGGTAAGTDGGTDTDPLRARAATLYRGRIIGFLRAGFNCPHMPEGAVKCSPTAVMSIGGDGTVGSVSFSPCGTPEIDSAAGAVANSKQGQQIPPPPENYADDPAFRISSMSVTYTCK